MSLYVILSFSTVGISVPWSVPVQRFVWISQSALVRAGVRAQRGRKCCACLQQIAAQHLRPLHVGLIHHQDCITWEGQGGLPITTSGEEAELSIEMECVYIYIYIMRCNVS